MARLAPHPTDFMPIVHNSLVDPNSEAYRWGVDALRIATTKEVDRKDRDARIHEELDNAARRVMYGRFAEPERPLSVGSVAK